MTLQVTTPSDREVLVVREFNAPRQLLFDALTKPELVKRWCYGYDGWSMPVCEIDARVGGRYRYRWRNDSDGSEFGFVGEFKEIDAPSKIVHREFFDPGTLESNPDSPTANAARSFPTDDQGSLITNTLTEKNGKTTLTVRMLFPSKEARDGAVATGMTDGMEFSYARLQRVVLDAKAA